MNEPNKTTKTIVKGTESREETSESEDEYPLQFAPGNLYLAVRSKGIGKSITLQNFRNRSSK